MSIKVIGVLWWYKVLINCMKILNNMLVNLVIVCVYLVNLVYKK